ncbi:hypothetical protein L207DRAFT_242494 [Hyaloscypha variabilis F]|uniref:Uncharacterized protein n=1 Tax=Hyaloscypha variabilis (strain UAMH 11265 / GT02V1 / F) TaxID=1149755 RepID=A0A2J6S2B4_HYAVF|nr:hypothetical protein L207DRAFT_242494 [Hyaloscypha variabilis F]
MVPFYILGLEFGAVQTGRRGDSVLSGWLWKRSLDQHTWRSHSRCSTRDFCRISNWPVLQKFPVLSIVPVHLGKGWVSLSTRTIIFFFSPHHHRFHRGATLLQAHRPSNDEHLIGNLTRETGACHSLLSRSSPVLAHTMSQIHGPRLGLVHLRPCLRLMHPSQSIIGQGPGCEDASPHVFFFSWPWLAQICVASFSHSASWSHD